MNLKFPKLLAEAIGESKLKPYGMDFRKFSWGEIALYLDVRPLTTEQLDKLVTIVTEHIDLRGAKTIIEDVKTWSRALAAPEKAKPKNMTQFYSILHEYLRPVPGHRIYQRDEERDTWVAYYVESMEYHPPQRVRGGGVIPDYVEMVLYWNQLGGRTNHTISFTKRDITGTIEFVLRFKPTE